MFVTLIVLSLGVLMMVVERLKPGRIWPTVRNWWIRAIALNLVQVGMVFLAGYTWNGWMVRQRPWSADRLGLIGGSLCGYIVITFVYYWWHRWRHEVGFLWRWIHQVHHSPQRIEIITSFYKHPIEFLANGLLSSAIAYWLVGLNARAATLAVTLTGIAELFYHWNVKTPHWIGYLIQRPESHLVHHQDGLHAYNYADLPLWDIVFGTFRNPREWNERCGFGDRERAPPGDAYWEGCKRSAVGRQLGGAQVNRDQVSAVVLVILGTAQIVGDLSGALPLKAIAAATVASPAPKVFSAVQGLETYSMRFYIEWAARRIELTPEVYSRIHGPYNRRNVYGAVLAYAPFIPAKLRDPVIRYALCGNAPLLRELAVDVNALHGSVVIVLEPLARTRGDLPTHFPVSCENAGSNSRPPE